MDRKLRILILEDSLADADLLVRQLRKGGMSFVGRRAENRDTFVKQLEEFQPDLILSDYAMPSFNGLAALDLIRQRPQEIPFIFVSGAVGDELAVETLKLGATDYLLKDRLSRLPMAIHRAMREVEEHAERLRLEEQFRQAGKMEAIGRLSGSIAHDFNNVLTAIIGFGKLLEERAELEGPNRMYLEEIIRNAERAASLTGQLLAFSRQQLLRPEVLDLNVVVANMDRLLQRVIREDIDLVTLLDPSLGRVKADPGQVEQVVLNLAVNARDAMPGGGKLTIETANVELDDAYVRGHLAGAPGPHVMLVVSDTGVGMDAETQARIFEPFFTTKEQGKGTGLGLATVYGIVKQSDGYIWVYSEPGHGTTFKVYLPTVAEEVSANAGVVAPEAFPRGSETVLLVEDEEGVRRLANEVLQGHGYRVLEASNGDEARAICEGHDGPIHLLLTDVVMPGLNGRELASALAALRPEMKVVYMSGYTSDAGLRNLVLQEHDAFLEKPFTPAGLIRKVRTALDVSRKEPSIGQS